LIVDFRDDRTTERIIDFSADAPCLLDMTLFAISFNFFSLKFAREAVVKLTSFLVAIGFLLIVSGLRKIHLSVFSAAKVRWLEIPEQDWPEVVRTFAAYDA
jgi:hypothetical protein